jgi:F0F1-type ATP synthase delta subunit
VAAQAPKAAADLQAELAARDQQRLAAWTETLSSMATTLSNEWEQAGTRTATRQQEICDTLAQTARDISAQTQAHASSTIAEIGQLVQAASEAPKAAAEVVAELRQKLSDSMVRDTAMLAERSRLLATLETLLDAVNHASTEQRSAVDALVATSADLLDRVGTRFTDKVELETGKLGAIAAQVTGSAVEVASLGEAFGAAVQLFGESNTTLVAHLQRIEAALDKSLARSDEQLAYYVAQAREVIDLSMMSQKQIVEDLQQLAGKRASAGVEAA